MTRYREALRWLYGLESRGIKLGLDRIAEAAELRGHPERATRFVHVAGTNGKGSVATMVESVMRAAGYRTGQFASPHLQRYVERVRIGGRPISEREAANRIEELRADTRLPPLSFFEYTTMLAFEAFRDARCDIVVLEVGLGGRLDSTNIVTPEVSVITNISLEHQRILGDTLAKIAREKAGVLKPGVPCVVGARGKSARRAISVRASAVEAPLRWIDRDFESAWDGRSLSVRVGERRWSKLRLGLRGDYQGDNAACVLATLVELQERDFKVSDAHVRSGLKRARWPGRLEWHRGQPAFLFDAAHNATGCDTLARYLDDLEFPGRVVLLFGAMHDKDHRRMLAAFDGRVDRRIYAAPELARSEGPERLAKIRKGTVARSIRDAVARAQRAAGPDGLVVVAGSIFLLAETRALVKNVPTDPPIAM
ncbi:MAG: bifunctional folylpolyglutamate synthase/dihydrofolate synthase [Deltaproteobacteria bacterium]|nr:MAG: bifunctional folylpolyglutamate synthase/dihydrofolate synthase [Deltaproteobacteria bacterium]